ncbi:ATP synthase subunit I [Chitinimonas sp. BJB300]|uniref:ATP synthase subunit I n=1 Tax=Chitinimonas sp. BJB300 TaxID=1559339 RepID=UPI000C107270|nr:ATP synthase subunit I [Chitinimonas sp. BJB300]PHV10562.1 ATPase F0F1 [Chitinimonas sp. BJB300]TSJ87071.1 ATP synthase subunit I [Chitinimonas sp. BJB300]
MSELLSLVTVLLVGIVLGTLFFGGLWWTVRRAVSSRWVALWFITSLVVRMGTVLVGFYLACGSNWQRWLAAILGFSLARLTVTRLTQSSAPTISM